MSGPHRLTLPLGLVVEDMYGKTFVYIGHKELPSGSQEHKFVMARQERKGVHVALWEFDGVKPATLFKKFPRLRSMTREQLDEASDD